MDFSRPSSSSSRSSRGGASKKPDIYSTVVIHGENDDRSDRDDRPDSDSEDSSSLPPLLQRLPKDFGAAIGDEDDEDDDDDEFFGTFIVKKEKDKDKDRSKKPSASPSARRTIRSPFQDLRRSSPRSRSDLDDVYSTFVVKSTLRSSPRDDEEEESVSGTFVRKTGSGALESMRGNGDDGGRLQRQEQVRRKASVSSVPESLTREDPSTKYELLHELG